MNCNCVYKIVIVYTKFHNNLRVSHALISSNNWFNHLDSLTTFLNLRKYLALNEK